MGNEINSGSAGIDNSDSILELGVELVRAGNMSFDYKVDAENRYDAFLFLVDGALILRETNVYSYTTFEVGHPNLYSLASLMRELDGS